MCTNGTQVPCEVPSLPNPTTRKGWPHHRGLWPLLFSNSDGRSFTSHKNKSVKVLCDGTYGFSSLSRKTRKSNHLKMSLQRQHFLLSYLKTLSVGSAGVPTRDLLRGGAASSSGPISWCHYTKRPTPRLLWFVSTDRQPARRVAQTGALPAELTRRRWIDERDGFDRLKNIYACGRAGSQNSSWKLNFLYPATLPTLPSPFAFLMVRRWNR